MRFVCLFLVCGYRSISGLFRSQPKESFIGKFICAQVVFFPTGYLRADMNLNLKLTGESSSRIIGRSST